VLFEAAGKAVMPVVIANKIKEVRADRDAKPLAERFYPDSPIGPGGNPGNRYVL
jgi:hypothetical protein